MKTQQKTPAASLQPRVMVSLWRHLLKVGGLITLYKLLLLLFYWVLESYLIVTLHNVTEVGEIAGHFVQRVCDNRLLSLYAVSASASTVTPSADTTVSNGVYVPGGIANGDVKSAVSTTPLADFLMQLEEYTPTVSFCLNEIEQSRPKKNCLFKLMCIYKQSNWGFLCFNSWCHRAMVQ